MSLIREYVSGSRPGHVNLIIYDTRHRTHRLYLARNYQSNAYAIFRRMHELHQLFDGLSGDSYNYAPNGDITVNFPSVIREILRVQYSPNIDPELALLATQYINSLPTENEQHYSHYRFQITEDIALGTRDGLAYLLNETGESMPIWDNEKIYSLMGYMNRISDFHEEIQDQELQDQEIQDQELQDQEIQDQEFD